MTAAKPPLTDAQLNEWYDKHKDNEAVFMYDDKERRSVSYDFLKVHELVRLAILKLKEETK